MSAAIDGQVRVAFTLVRAAVEAAIFEVAAATDKETFRNKWSTRDGTGGAVLRSLKGLDPRIKFLLETTWRLVVEFGHASRIPVLSAVGRARSGTDIKKTISFAGQYAGPFDAKLLHNIVNIYSIAAIACVEAMNIAVIPLVPEQRLWRSLYALLNRALDVKVEVPEHLADSVKSEWGQSLRKNLRGDA